MVAPVLPFWAQSVAAAAPSFVGSVVGAAASRKERIAAENQTRKLRAEDRAWFLEDQREAELYAAGLTKKDRQYAEKMRDDERNYAREILVDERVYDRKLQLAGRQYERNLAEKNLANDRAYLQQKQDAQRRYDDKMYEQDIAQYSKDRNLMQDRSNSLAEKSAASRGIDFVKLRDDAVKAGYNPMTALSMAHAYSTNVDYSVQGGVYSPRANYTTDNLGYAPTSVNTGAGARSGGGGGGAPAGAVMPSSMPAAGNFQAAGGGYQADFSPALAAGSFVKEAMERGIDSWSNSRVERDPLADALRNAFQQDQMAQEVRDSQIPGDFGYSLTKQRPFQPEATIGVPAFASAKSGPAPAKMPSGMVEVGGRKYIPVTKPDGKPGRLEASIAGRLDIAPFDTVSPGDWAEIVGEVGELESLASQPAIRRNVTDEWHIGTSIGDYVKSGVTGTRQFPSGQHFNPWGR